MSSETFLVSPLEHAVETMEKSNKELKRAMTDDRCKETMIKHLTLRLNGILDARVQGGLENYERTFLMEKYLACHPDHAPLVQRLKDLISEQVPLLEQGLQIFEIHDSRNADLHAHLVHRYLTVYGRYGATYFDEKTQLSATQMPLVVRQKPSTVKSDSRSNSRLSDVSSGNESIVSKISIVTKSNFNKISWLRNTSTQTSSKQKPHKSKESKRQSRLSVQYERDSLSALSDIDDMLPESALCRRCSHKSASLRSKQASSKQSYLNLNASTDCLLDDV